MNAHSACIHRIDQLRRAALDDALRGFECLAAAKAGFLCGDIAGVALSIRKYFRTLFLDVLVAAFPAVQPLRDRLRQREGLPDR